MILFILLVAVYAKYPDFNLSDPLESFREETVVDYWEIHFPNGIRDHLLARVGNKYYSEPYRFDLIYETRLSLNPYAPYKPKLILWPHN